MDTASLLNSLHLDCKGFKQLLDAQLLVDCTLACDGGKISAHKIVLSACSSYLAKIILEHPVEHPIIILPELDIEDVKTLVHYMYTGELLKTNTLHSTSLLRTAAILSVNSLNDLLNGSATTTTNNSSINNFNNSNNFFNNFSSTPIFLRNQPARSTTSNQHSSLTSSSSTSPMSLISDPINPASLTNKIYNSANNLDDSGIGASIYLGADASNINNLGIDNGLSGQNNDSIDLHKQKLDHCQIGTNGNTAATTTTTNTTTIASITNSASKSGFQFKCPVCQNDFQTICSFEYHMQRAHNVTSFGCEICHKPFASLRYVLLDHMNRCHGTKPIVP